MPRRPLAALSLVLALAIGGAGVAGARSGHGPVPAGTGTAATTAAAPSGGEFTRERILARIHATLARTRDPQKRAILKGLAWLQDFVAPDDILDAVFSNYVMMLNELTTQRSRPAITPIAEVMLRHAFARAQTRMKSLFADDEDGKIDFLQILHVFRKWGTRKNYREFFIDRFPKGFSIDYKEMFDEAIEYLDYDELGSVIIDTSFYHTVRMKYPNLEYKLPKGNFPRFMQELTGIPYIENFKEDPDGYSDQNYFVTHIVFAAIYYGEGPVPQNRLMDETRAYLEREFDTVRHEVDDIDLLAEFVHCLKILERGDTPQVTEAIRYMLDIQNEDGSWGKPEDFEQSPYDAFHPTWAVLVALNY